MPILQPDSADLVVRFMVARHQYLLLELARLQAVLIVYVTGIQPKVERPAISLLEHYAMLDAPECGCSICLDWEQRRLEFVEAVPLIPKGHKWTICGCPRCRFVGRLQLNYLAATNRRDLLIEMSFHARYHSRHGNAVMAWFEREMRNPAYTDNWCAQEMSRFPVERWIKRCEMAVSGFVSGAVFQIAAGVTDALYGIGSSLGTNIGLEQEILFE
jgi:hypothetical protein